MARRKSVQLKAGGRGGGPSWLVARQANASSFGPRRNGKASSYGPRGNMKSLFVWPFLIKLSQTLSCNGRGGSLFFFGPQELGIASATLLHAPRRPSNVQNGHITPCSQRPDLISESLCSKLTKASHAQRTPLNMGALHCVTDNHMHIYTARTSGEVKDMRRPLRFRTSTRGFATTVELQQAMSRGPVLARRLRRRQGGNRRELRGRGSATVERWWLRVEQPHAPAACASWQPHHATRRCSSTMS